MTTTSVPTRSPFVQAVLTAFGVYSTLIGLFMLMEFAGPALGAILVTVALRRSVHHGQDGESLRRDT
jgi:hypothetical protein